IEVDISVVDFANGYRPSDWINNQLFRGNEYFYNLLTSANSGLHYSALYGDIPGEALSEILVSQADLITEFDLDLDPENGFTYSNYMNTFNLNAFVNNAPLMITGKFIGTFPFELALKGISNNTIFEKSFVIPQSRAFTLNDKASKIWHGQFILNNEFNNNNQITADVIDISREQRLLSAKTIFLCLEPDTISISSANTNNENDWVVSTEEPQNNTTEIKVYPNPFVERLTIEIPFDGNQDEIRIQIVNSLGSEVLVKNLEKEFNEEQLILTWESDESLKAGIYFIHIQSDGINEIRKVIYAGR
ncbi:MAG: T9SS type A sorting domain-containing protein, partial [Saprospiraceae bacterium]|nr:T9SS type A sorting domain-containing protein [Saprospiraceae bacterium]